MSIVLIDRDGTLIEEPEDYQVDRLDKVRFIPGVIPGLMRLKAAGFRFVMLSNQDGLGSASFPKSAFQACQQFILDTLAACGITFEQILICPHFEYDNCRCRKPKTGLLDQFLLQNPVEKNRMWMIGDRHTDVLLANNIGIPFKAVNPQQPWEAITHALLFELRGITITRETRETRIKLSLQLDSERSSEIKTPIPFFTHLLEQVAKHGGFYLHLNASGDVDVDDHHLIEDTAILLGEALKQALGNKHGIQRFGFTLPMDESCANISLDLCGRTHCTFHGQFIREYVGNMATEMVPHFFRSFAAGLNATIHIQTQGENHHHMIEACFKVLGQALRQATKRIGHVLPSTKGCL